MSKTRKKVSQKKISSWGKAIQDKKSRQARLFAKWAFLFLGIFLLAGFLIEIVRNIRLDSWNGKDQISLVVVQPENVLLIVLKPEFSEAVLVKVPNETIVDGAFGFGEVKIGSLTGLAEIEKVSQEKLVLETIRQNFAVPVERFLELKRPEENLTVLFFFPLIGQIGQNKTNMTKLELIRTLWFVKSLRPDQVKSFDLKDAQALFLRKEPDGSEVYSLQKEQLDIFINRYFSNADLAVEETTWEILNAIDYPGLAEMVARILRNSGSMVVGVRTLLRHPLRQGFEGQEGYAGHSTEKDRQSAIYMSKGLKNSYGVGFWSRILQLPIKEGLPENAKSDVIVVLRQDFLETF